MLKTFFLAVCTAFVSACATALPFASYAQLSGSGQIRTDLNGFAAFGDLEGTAGVFLKGSGLLSTQNFSVSQGQVYLYRDGQSENRPLTEPLPLWVKSLFAPGQLAELEHDLGFVLQFEQSGE